MNAANWLTLLASLVALASVVGSYLLGRKQIESTATLALKQIDSAAKETSRKLRAEIVVKENQVWIKEFRETINEILYLGDPDVDHIAVQPAERLRAIVRLAHKIDLLMPVGEAHASLMPAIISYSEFLRAGAPAEALKDRLAAASQIITLARRILKDQLQDVAKSL
jgi:hypothetical protein